MKLNDAFLNGVDEGNDFILSLITVIPFLRAEWEKCFIKVSFS